MNAATCHNKCQATVMCPLRTIKYFSTQTDRVILIQNSNNENAKTFAAT